MSELLILIPGNQKHLVYHPVRFRKKMLIIAFGLQRNMHARI